MTSVIGLIGDIFGALFALFGVVIRASKELFIIIFILAPITGAVIAVAFDTAAKANEDNPTAQAVINGTRAAYEVGGTVQDFYDYAKIIIPVIAAAGGLVALLKRLGKL